MSHDLLGLGALLALVPLTTAGILGMDGYVPAQTLAALTVGALLASGIGLMAWRLRALTPSGVLGAVVTGTLIFGLGGWAGGLALVGFFVSSSALSKLFRRRKAAVESEYAKTGTRDLAQALANGGVGAAAAMLFGLTGNSRFLGAMLGAIATANADTWATELGVLARRAPRLITTFRSVPPGTSGAISVVGTAAAAAGAAVVALVAAAAHPPLWASVHWLTLAGVGGALTDSLLGASVQAVYWCPKCQKETERERHYCGEATLLHRGRAWLDNDGVNLLATAAGAVFGYLLV